MRIGYMGSPEISARLLETLSKHHEIAFVISNPDRPKKRSGTPESTPVASLALAQGWPLFRPESLKDGALLPELRDLAADVHFVFSYGKILPEALFNIPRYSTLNLHGSILPLLRGASPIQSALLAGMTETGWTLQKITKELDAGDILGEVRLAISPDDRASELTEKMMPLAAELSLRILENLPQALASAKPQDHAKATFCSKMRREDARIDWNLDSQSIHNRVRAYYPSPCAWAILAGKTCRILRARPSELNWPARVPGGIWTENGKMYAGSGSASLEILELQLEGKKPLQTSEFLRGFRAEGARFE
jgi:methionyl-tRNA formyltransferase